MTLQIGSIRKVVNVTWNVAVPGAPGDANLIGGMEATLEAAGQEKRVVKNTTEGGDLFFPLDFTGPVEVTVRGSAAGEETATLTIT